MHHVHVFLRFLCSNRIRCVVRGSKLPQLLSVCVGEVSESFLFFLLQVNKNFAIDLIAEQPVSEVESRVISCDGGGGALGHPKVYINLDKDTKTGTCGYCGLQFKQKHH
uniref:NADH dehydrogenase [ubiquinone] iron-sulfur protein 6, mitochondrial n=1 Tax=Bubo bubo TaxID=30461 RepID=A0A8C0F7L0_BUBBB